MKMVRAKLVPRLLLNKDQLDKEEGRWHLNKNVASDNGYPSYIIMSSNLGMHTVLHWRSVHQPSVRHHTSFSFIILQTVCHVYFIIISWDDLFAWVEPTFSYVPMGRQMLFEQKHLLVVCFCTCYCIDNLICMFHYAWDTFQNL